MNHSFNARITTEDKPHFDVTPRCALCNRYEVDHTDSATCESCGQIAKCELISDELLCQTCMSRDKEIQQEIAPTSPTDARITELKNKFHSELASRTNMREYFVGQVTSIVEMESAFNDKYALAQQVEDNLNEWKRIRAESYKKLAESETRLVVDQLYLNQLVPQLRQEEREKFKQYDISYKPSEVKPVSTVSKPRMSATDRQLESAAKLLNVSVEQYKQILAKQFAALSGNQCSCKETPGICKVHPS